MYIATFYRRVGQVYNLLIDYQNYWNHCTFKRVSLILNNVYIFTPILDRTGFPYSLPSAGPRADHIVQAVSPQVTISHPPGGRLPLLSARSVVTSPATENHRPLAGTKLYCLMTEAHRCEQLAQGYAALPRVGFELTTSWLQVQHSIHCVTSTTGQNTR